MSRRDDILSKIHPRYHAQIEAARTEPRRMHLLRPAPESKPEQATIIRQDQGDGMDSKTERLFFAYMEARGTPVEVKPVTFRLANGVRYTPDFGAWDENDRLTCWEIKGAKLWDDAIVKLKVAASQRRGVKFILVQKRRDIHAGAGAWRWQEILP